MATRVKRKSKIGKRLAKAAKKGETPTLLGPGSVLKSGKAVTAGLKAIRDRLKRRLANPAKPIKGPDTRSLAQRRGKVGDLTKTPTSELSAADKIRKGTQLRRKRLIAGQKTMGTKVPRK